MSETFEAIVKKKRTLLRTRTVPQSAESVPPTGQAGLWYDGAIMCLPPSGQLVARQVARLCGDDSQVTLPWRSLADAVGRSDKGGRLVAYTQRGVESLVETGWLRVETIGRKRGAKTTFYLMPGEPTGSRRLDDQPEPLEEVA